MPLLEQLRMTGTTAETHSLGLVLPSPSPQGFRYKLRLAYSHFPITVEEEGDVLQIRNFMGTRAPRVVRLHDGVSVAKSSDVKDQLELTGNDIHAVSKSAALLHDTCMVRNKDIRKFLDGVYVAEKGAIGKEKSLY